jgi:HAD superfamily hydrolase (TIGR01490 family)
MRTVVFFDLDNTLIDGQTQKIMAFYLWERKQITSFFLFRTFVWFFFYKLGIVRDVTQIMKKAYRLARGIEVSSFQSILEDLVSEEIEPRIFPQALKIIEEHQKQGHRVGLVSNSIAPLVEILEKKLRLSFSIATQLERENNVFTGEIEGKVMYGEEKLKAVTAYLLKTGGALENSYAITDHNSDLPLLKAVGHPAVVNPDSILRKKAKCYHWPIFNWDLTSSI